MEHQCKVSAFVAAVILLAGCHGGTTRTSPPGAEAITPLTVRAHMEYLASDALRGRNTPSPELDTAAAYIARVFARSGLLPAGGSYLQRVPLNKVSLGDTNTLTVIVRGVPVSYLIKEDFTPFDMTANKAVEAPLVFAGYGITAPEYNYDDYAGLDVRGKVVFVLRHEPGEDDTASVFKGKRATDYSNVSVKTRIAIEHGAVGMLVATDPLNHTSLAPRGFPWPSLSRIIPKDALPMTLGVEESEKIPVLHVGPGVIQQIFGSVDSLRRLQEEIDAAVSPRSFPIPEAVVRARTSTVVTMLPTSNVVGVLEGADSLLRKEIVVVGAHYDHVGYTKGSPPDQDSIYNGADDNASGTVGLLAIADALRDAGARPKRTIVLIAFAGEEKGLFGSEYYARNPLFPLAHTVAMLNMDMIGRNSEDSLELIGAGKGSFLVSAARAANAGGSMVLEETSLAMGGSDHMSFSKRKVPVLFFHSGLHADYHQPSDEADRINYTKLTRVAQLVYRTAWSVADADSPLISTTKETR